MPTFRGRSGGSYGGRHCPSGYSSSTMNVDILMDTNVTETILFQICIPSDDNSLELGLGLGLGLGIPALILIACLMYCYWPRICKNCRRGENHHQLVPREISPSVYLFEYFGQNLHRQFNAGILTDELRASIRVAPQTIRNHIIAVAIANNRQEIMNFMEYLN
jgi:hypothetical protein